MNDLIREDYLIPNEYSRPQTPKFGIRGIVTHWVENPGSSAVANRRYFQDRSSGKTGYGSAEFIIDDQEIVHDIPLWETAYHVGSGRDFPEGYTKLAVEKFAPYPSSWLIGVEWCHPDWSGKPSPRVLSHAIWLYAGLCLEFALDPMKDIYTHHDITGKITERGPCHKWFVEHPDEFYHLKLAVNGVLLHTRGWG